MDPQTLASLPSTWWAVWGESALEIYRTFKQEIAKEKIYDNTRGIFLLYEARTRVLRTKTYRAKYEGVDTREKRDSTCFLPGCNSGYRSCKTKFSLFRGPKEPERLQQWTRNIKRDDKRLDDACVFCERHFEPSFIERTFKIVIQGNVEEILRDVPLLAKEAVPTAFSDAPKYLYKPLPQKRKERNLCEQAPWSRPPPSKGQCRDADAVSVIIWR
ncbi:hypothetical protein HPB51_024392 [Rhipicephalus microplus]|uniref:THAP-type domain-containing protein n=1 Tax=Rhipicephalus microplus TaxID=6941 RepID=A0A9J6D7L4_RHIMP|nr:hypothetical protein HPB51_024392 [Rhipicephalus microplus]